MCSADTEGAWGHFEESLATSEKPEKCYECDTGIPAGTHFMRIEAWDEDQCGGDSEDENGEPVYLEDNEPRPGEDPAVYELHAECAALSDFVRDHICKVEHDMEQKAKSRRDFVEYFHGYIPLGGLGSEIESLADYCWALTAEDAADAYAMGFEIEGDGEVITAEADGSANRDMGFGVEMRYTGCPAQVAKWLQGLIAAEYAEVTS